MDLGGLCEDPVEVEQAGGDAVRQSEQCLASLPLSAVAGDAGRLTLI